MSEIFGNTRDARIPLSMRAMYYKNAIVYETLMSISKSIHLLSQDSSGRCQNVVEHLAPGKEIVDAMLVQAHELNMLVEMDCNVTHEEIYQEIIDRGVDQRKIMKKHLDKGGKLAMSILQFEREGR